MTFARRSSFVSLEALIVARHLVPGTQSSTSAGRDSKAQDYGFMSYGSSSRARASHSFSINHCIAVCAQTQRVDRVWDMKRETILHHDRVKHAGDGAGHASNEPPFCPRFPEKI